MPKKESETPLTPEQLQDRVAELETENLSLRNQLNPPPVPLTPREKEIRRRMDGGHLRRDQATECAEHQSIEDTRRAAQK